MRAALSNASGTIGEQRAKLRLAVKTVLAVGQEQTVRRRLVERGAMADRGEHVEQRLVVGGGVIRRRARHQRDVRGTGDRRAFRDEPAISRVQVIAHEHRRTLTPETLPGPAAHDGALRGGHRAPAHRPPRCVSHRSARCSRRAPPDQHEPAHSRRATSSTAIPAIPQGTVPPSAEALPGAPAAAASAAGIRGCGRETIDPEIRRGDVAGDAARASRPEHGRRGPRDGRTRPDRTRAAEPASVAIPSITAAAGPLTPASCEALTARHSWRYPVRLRARRRRREPPASSSSVPMIGWIPCAFAAWISSTAPYRPLRSQRPSAEIPSRAAVSTIAPGRGGAFQEGVVGTGGEFGKPGHRHDVAA